MGLEGYLEDLGICDILQILSLSKKSGTLTLKSRQGEGLVCFLDGQVIRATSSLFPEGLGQLLRRHNLVTEAQVEEALMYQQSLKSHQPLGPILIDKFQLSCAQVEQLIAAQIEKIIFSFLSWRDGFFSFHLEEMQAFGSALLNPLDFMLEKGLSPQKLVIKGQKINQRGASSVDDEAVERELAELNDRQKQQGVALLRGMLAELENPDFSGGILLLILRYASEIMGRAIVFDVRGRQLVGLGQFGLEGLSSSADEIVRKMRLGIDPDSLFERVLYDKVAIRSVLKESASENTLKSFLGGIPDEVFVAPLISEGKVVAMLYGDGFLPQRPLRAIEAFEVFLSQAGLAMEQALQGNT